MSVSLYKKIAIVSGYLFFFGLVLILVDWWIDIPTANYVGNFLSVSGTFSTFVFGVTTILLSVRTEDTVWIERLKYLAIFLLFFGLFFNLLAVVTTLKWGTIRPKELGVIGLYGLGLGIAASIVFGTSRYLASKGFKQVGAIIGGVIVAVVITVICVLLFIMLMSY